MKILVGGALPYANGALHIGHLAALLPGDVIARYHRAAGHEVCYVSGSDCHGTPVAIRAAQEGKTPAEISDLYHEAFRSLFSKLGFSFDLYGKTSAPQHKAFVRAFHRHMYAQPFVYEKDAPQAVCPHCRTNLVDRMVLGECPFCGAQARGDQCDACNAVLEAPQLLGPRCGACGQPPAFLPDRHLYIAIRRLEAPLRQWLAGHRAWRKNALAFSHRYLDEGLRDRAITRTLDWGIDVPKAGYEAKKIYIWAENVLGYLSMTEALAQEGKADFDALWHGGSGVRHYYVHGKDSIPFHTIILPALLLAHGEGWHLPDDIISSEHMTLEGRRISTSRNWAIWLKDIADRYHPDAIRYYFLAHGPEKRDADFTWREFMHSTNAELIGAYGNFVNRCTAFIHRYLGGAVPGGPVDPAMGKGIAAAYADVGALLARGQCKDALEVVFACVRQANRYFDDQAPWLTRESDPVRCGATLHTCVQLIANLATLLSPFLPFSSAQVLGWFGLDSAWQAKTVPGGFRLPDTPVLFTRLDKAAIEAEEQALREKAGGEAV